MDDWKLICRVCETKEELINLFAAENDDLLAMLRFIVQIDIEEEDLLPNYICANCSCRLQHAYIFKRQCEATYRKLREAYLSKVDEIIDVKSEPSEDLVIFEYNQKDASQIIDMKPETPDSVFFEYNETDASQWEDGELSASDNELLETDIIEECKSDIDEISSVRDVEELITENDEISSVRDVEELITENTIMKVAQNSLKETSKGDASVADTSSDKINIFTPENLEQQIEYIDESFDQFNTSENVERSQTKDTILSQGLRKNCEKIIETHDPNDQKPKIICGFILDETQGESEPAVKETDRIMFRKPGRPRIYSSRKKRPKHFVCDTCSQVFTNYKEINEHKRSHGRNRYQCSVCSKWFAKKDHFKLHLKIHEGTSEFACTLCDRKYSTRNNLRRHVRFFHHKERKHPCLICCKSFARRSELDQHQYVHTDERKFACDQCSKTFKSTLALYVHKKRHDPGSHQKLSVKRRRQQKRTYHFICQFCGKSSSNRTYHENHLRIHTGEKPFECQTCGKVFPIKISLTTHMLTHTDIRPHSCNLCDATFRQSGHLKAHQNMHMGVKPYSCDICGKSFSGGGTLKTHKRIHTGERPYHCTDCDRRFIDTNALKRHKLTHIRNTRIPDAEQKVEVRRNELLDGASS